MAVENLEHYTLERLVKECQKVSGSRNAVKLVIVHRSRNSQEWIGEEYPVASDERDNIHSTTYFGAVDVAWLEGDKSDADKVSSLLRWLDNSCPTLSRIDNWYKGALRLVELATEGDINAPLHVPRNTYLVRAKSDITTVCSRLLASKDKSACFALTKLEINHFKKYPSCQWIMEWGDVVSAIEVAALKLAGEHIDRGISENDEVSNVSSLVLTKKDMRVFEVMFSINKNRVLTIADIKSRTIDNSKPDSLSTDNLQGMSLGKIEKHATKGKIKKNKRDGTIGKDFISNFLNKLKNHVPPLAESNIEGQHGSRLTRAGRKLYEERTSKYK